MALNSRKLACWVGGGLLAIFAAAAVLLWMRWPFTKQALIDTLQESSRRTVTIDRFRTTYFPPGCEAEGIHFERLVHKEKAPLITVNKLYVRGSYAGMIVPQKRLAEVVVRGMHVIVPPSRPDGTNSIMPVTQVKGGKKLLIGSVVADGALLDFMAAGGKEAYQIKVDQLRMEGVGGSGPIRYHLVAKTSTPSGKIESDGNFGPWDPHSPGATQVSGDYSYSDADLSGLVEISGHLNSRGKFSGKLGSMEVTGSASVAHFHVGHSSHDLPVVAQFAATVNGTTGDVVLDQVRTDLNRSRLFWQGTVQGDKAGQGKDVALEVTTDYARVEDLLDLVLSSPRPPMTGAVSIKGRVTVPPGDERFLKKIRFDGAVDITGARFTNPDAQQPLNRLSESAVPGGDWDGQNLPTAFSNIRGHVSGRNGIAALTNVRLTMDGSEALMQGSYDLIGEEVNLHGTLRTDGKVYSTAKGFKSILLRVVNPFFKHKAQETIVGFKITGKYPHPTIGLEKSGKR